MFARHLGRRLALWMMLLSLAVEAGYIGYRFSVDLPVSRARVLADVETVIAAIEPSAAAIVFQYNEKVGSHLLNVFRSVPAIQGAWLTDNQHEVLAGYISANINLGKETRETSYPLLYAGQRVGYLLVEVDMLALNGQILRELIHLGLASLFIALLSTLLLIWLVRRLVAHPLEELAADVAAIDVKDPQPALLRHKLPARRDEIGQLQRAITDLVAALAASTEAKAQAMAELSDLNANLEELVRERTLALALETEKAQVANHAKTEFLTMVTHELRTPLNSILGFSDILMRQELNSRSAECAGLIRGSGQHLLQLINDIIEYVELEQKPLLCQAFSMHDVVMGLRNRYQHKAHVQFNLHLPEAVPVLQGDVKRLDALLRQLLDNAFKFTEQGMIELKTTYFGGEQCLELRISDTGCGIDLERLDEILQAFSQGNAVLTRHQGGNGMGLAIVNRIVQRWGGQLNFAYNQPNGTVVTVRLPCTALG